MSNVFQALLEVAQTLVQQSPETPSFHGTLGAALVIAGLALQGGFSLVTVKLGFILFFVYVTSPTACHALAKTAFRRGVKPALDEEAPSSKA